jgi:hypothetical protein
VRAAHHLDGLLFARRRRRGRITPDDPGAADVRFEIASASDRHAISPWIYGSNQVDDPDTHGVSMGRIGGNRWTAYNWETNASNAGSDYLYQNDTYLGGGSSPGGAVAGPVGDLHDADLGALLTVPIAGWVSADTTGPTPSDGSGRGTRFLPTEASGGTLGGAPSLSDGTVYTDEFVDWVRRTLMPDGTVFFSLDNEPDLWSSTHSEIHPTAVTYAELVTRNVEHATAITSVVPEAVVFGPVNYGYAGFMNLQAASDAGARLHRLLPGRDERRRRHRRAPPGGCAGRALVPRGAGRGRAHHRRRDGRCRGRPRACRPRARCGTRATRRPAGSRAAAATAPSA